MHCEHGGVQFANGTNCTCICVEGFSGDHCEIHPHSCPDVSDPCACGEHCGWNSEFNRCVTDDITTCDECAEVCINGTCGTFSTFCPAEINLFLNCQCDLNCGERGDCCSDAEICPSENGCPRTDDPCECGNGCGWNSFLGKCTSDATTTCDECVHECSCLTFEESCPIEFNASLPCQCDDHCTIFGDCCDDHLNCTLGNHFLIFLNHIYVMALTI